jgi:hypothetical protein
MGLIVFVKKITNGEGRFEWFACGRVLRGRFVSIFLIGAFRLAPYCFAVLLMVVWIGRLLRLIPWP